MVVFLIAFSLSMDAFSLSLIYGTLNFSKKEMIYISIVVGIFHFVMPFLGNLIGINLLKIIPFKLDLLTFLIFMFIGIDMIIETKKDKEYEKISGLLQTLLFAFAVSIDSLITGVTIKNITNKYIFTYLLFCIVSLSMTYLGFYFGKKINLKVGKISTIIGGIILMLIGVAQIIG